MKKLLAAALLLSTVYAKAQIGIGTTSPNSTLDVRGSLATPITTFSTNTTAGASDNLLIFTGTSAATLTLPTAVGITGREYWIKNASSNSSTLTIATTSSQTIDGLSSWSLTQTYKVIRLVSNGTNWYAASESLPGNSAGTAWIYGGNAVGSQQNIGTTSNFSLPFITNNTEKMRLTSTGNLGIGTSTFDVTNPEKLLVDAGTTSSFNVISGKGTINNYLQLNIQNKSSGGAASSDVVATANNGTESVNYIDMGINSSGYSSSGILGGTNDAYLYSTGDDLVIGNATTGKDLLFFTDGTATTNERMRITNAGKVGIGTSSPNYLLHLHETSSSSNWMQITNGATGTGTFDGFFYGVSASGQPQIWGEGDLAVYTGSGTTNNMTMTMKANGNVGINTATFDATNPERLLVDAGTTTSYNVISGKGSINNYLQLNIQNRSSGAAASSDVVASADNGSETANFIDMGINSSSYSTAGTSILNGINNAYLYTTGNDFIFGNATANKNLLFFTGGTATSNERIRIEGTGDVGIGTTNPTEKLDVGGNLRISGAFMPGNTAGTSGSFLMSNGAGVAPTWIDPAAYLAASAWILGGNTLSSTQNLGTVSNHDLPIITNNTEKMRITSAGKVGIGTSTINGSNPEQLIVDAGTNGAGAFQNVIVGKGNTNSYAQLNIQNGSNGTGASSDVVATANNGTESVNFIDMGINGGGNTSTGILGAANTAYIYSTGTDLAIGNGTSAKDLILFTGGLAAGNERLRATANGVTVTGSHVVSYHSGTGAYTVATTDYVVINTGTAATWTLPAASGCAGRVYKLVNDGTGAITLTQAVTLSTGNTSTNLSGTAGSNCYEIISDGSIWRKIN